MPKKTLEAIVESGNNFVVQVKNNQPKLCQELEEVAKKFQYEDTHIEEKNENGVKTTWQTYQYPFTSKLEKWKMIATLLVVCKTVIVGQFVSHYKRYYVSDNTTNKAKTFNDVIRSHWGIENYVHRPKDMCFNQDNNRIITHNNAINMAVFNVLALNNLSNQYKEKQQKKIKTNQILFRGNFENYLNEHRI